MSAHTHPSRLARTLQYISSAVLFVLAAALVTLALAPLYAGPQHPSFILGVILCVSGFTLLVMALLSAIFPERLGRWISLFAVICYAVVLYLSLSSGDAPLSAWLESPALTLGGLYLIAFLLGRYLARPHFTGETCDHEH
jgi:MFS family permease